MPLMQHIERCLRDAQYEVQFPTDDSSLIYFEDHSLFGFAVVYPTVEVLLQSWKGKQDDFLRAHAPFLRAAARKAWNCYTVHLTDATASEVEQQALFDIEEDFTSTRKVARAEVATAFDVCRALYPLLPIQNLLKMQESNTDTDIFHRLHDWPAGALKALMGNGTAEDIVELLVEGEGEI